MWHRQVAKRYSLKHSPRNWLLNISTQAFASCLQNKRGLQPHPNCIGFRIELLSAFAYEEVAGAVKDGAEVTARAH